MSAIWKTIAVDGETSRAVEESVSRTSFQLRAGAAEYFLAQSAYLFVKISEIIA